MLSTLLLFFAPAAQEAAAPARPAQQLSAAEQQVLSAAGLRHLSQKSQTWARSTQLLLLVCYAFLAASLVWMPS